MPKHPKTNTSNAARGFSRRNMLQLAAAAALPAMHGQGAHAAITGNSAKTSWAVLSDPTTYAQAWANRFTNVLLNPLDTKALGGIGMVYRPDTGTTNRYTIWAEQTTQSVLGVAGKNTTVWGYRNSETPPTYPGRTFEVDQGTPITVRWGNNLRTTAGPLPHLFAVDQTISIQTPTTGVPLAVHHHGSDSGAAFDGTPDQWNTPRRAQVGPGIAADNSLGQLALDQPMLNAQYLNTQEASLHWYHDHAESITRTNVYAGLAGLYVVRDANEAQLRAKRMIPQREFEVALVLQDRTFDAVGNLTYTANPLDYPQAGSPNNKFPANSPTHMPEQFGDVICVNGKAWPVMNVQARPYRVRILNGSDSRFYTLDFGSNTGVYQIGTDLGFLNNGVRLGTVTIAPGERADLVVDFSLYAGVNPRASQPQVNVDVINTAATPFPGGTAPTGGARRVMRFAVNQLYSDGLDVEAWLIPTYPLRQLVPALQVTPTAPAKVRRILLAEGVDTYGRITPLLGTYDPSNVANRGTLSLNDPITETPTLGSSEVWEFWNTSVDSHPVHMHLVQFRVLNRQDFTGTVAATVMTNGWQGVKLLPGAQLVGAAVAPPPQEKGWKDTVVCPPGQVTRIVANFHRRGKYVYHCHILSHEEHDMMRYYSVL
jgi:spore coat protein A, manganese oxidase